jgi:hypothetical protein
VDLLDLAADALMDHIQILVTMVEELLLKDMMVLMLL